MIAFDLLKLSENINEALQKINISKLKKKYSDELALWDPNKNMEINSSKDTLDIIAKRSKPEALIKKLSLASKINK